MSGPAHALPTPWAALLGLRLLSMVRWRGHAPTHLFGGHVIAGLTALPTLARRDRTTVTARPKRAPAVAA